MDENNEFLNNQTDASPADIPDDADITVNDDIPENEPAAEPDTNPYASQAEEYRRQVSEQAAQPDSAPAQENYQQGTNPYGRQPDGSPAHIPSTPLPPLSRSRKRKRARVKRCL